MDTFMKWVQKRRDEISLAAKYWPPIIKASIVSSLVWWVGALGLVFIATIIALVITYAKQGPVEMSSFFPPNFWWGFLIVLAAIFLYQTIVETANHIEKYRIGADKFTWNDVSKIIPDIPKHSPNLVGILISNKKPYDIQRGVVTVIRVQRDRFLMFSDRLPLNLCWVGGGGFNWSGRKLQKDREERRFLAVAGWLLPNQTPMLMTGRAVENGVGTADYINLEVDANYLITLQWHGELDGHPLDKFENSYWISFDGETFHLKEAEIKTIFPREQ